jgi:hypothetical protein
LIIYVPRFALAHLYNENTLKDTYIHDSRTMEMTSIQGNGFIKKSMVASASVMLLIGAIIYIYTNDKIAQVHIDSRQTEDIKDLKILTQQLVQITAEIKGSNNSIQGELINTNTILNQLLKK